ncbi:CaiB/BaiF CoA-transferase family protein [Fontimonas sp. SYSU GA230001]|uniref:CaiB/BaiF CoA transferase family protein n=1 Tax=Fontimonas sp. SYSU GA230001 TaxID=3142450 RepID=UPI0032B621D2
MTKTHPLPANPLLKGVRVLDLSRLLPGPFCTLYLAQMGAEIIKIEEPDGGDYARGTPELFSLVNRGKKSVTLDLRADADRARFLELVKTADVVLESFRPGVMARFGCDYDSLKKLNPKLVYAALSGYGQTGPYRDWAGHDMNYLAIAGVADQIGRAHSAPAQSNVQIADLAGGALTCAVGILAAVIGARASGQGTMVDVSMTDGSLALQVLALSTLRGEGQPPKRGADLLTGALPNYTFYRCRDGRYLAVGALEPKFFLKLLGVLKEQIPAPLQRGLDRALAGLTGKSKKSTGGAEKPKNEAGQFDKLNKLFGSPRQARMKTAPIRWALQAIFLTRTRDDWAALLESRDCCVTPILSIDESLKNEHIRARGMIEDDNGKPAFAFPVRFSDALEPAHPAPSLGADNDAVLGLKR